MKADCRARYEKVVEVVDNLRAAGVDHIGLLTELEGKAKAEPAGAPEAKRVTRDGRAGRKHVRVRWIRV